jgi:site-specific DNA-methyltransferase (adenine-specific)
LKPYYQDDSVTIYHGDSMEIVPALGRFDLVLTDPPYLIHAGKGGGAFGSERVLVESGGFTDMGCSYSFLDNAANWFVFCSIRQLRELLGIAENMPRMNLITWHKPNPLPTCNNKYLPDVEYIVHGFQKNRLFGDFCDKFSCIIHPLGDRETKHPNEKPMRIIRKLITLGTQEGETILDPFAGSGTTGRAAKDMGRKAVLIEREERYCEIAAKRMQQECLPFAKPASQPKATEQELF